MAALPRRLACLALLLPGLAHAEAPALQLVGKGVQIYGCTAVAGAYAWRLKAPEATLLDAAGQVVGHHFAGPSWQAADGSTVVGEVLAGSAAPADAGIPWLVLHARSHSGEGRFAGVTYITRTQTQGGQAPSTGCDQAHAGAELRVDYSATYTLFTGGH